MLDVEGRPANTSRLPFQPPQFGLRIEVQTGTYLGEDDIVRLADGYGRTHAISVTALPTLPDLTRQSGKNPNHIRSNPM